MKWVCSICGYVYEGPEPPEKCPQCGAPASKFNKMDEDAGWADQHVVVDFLAAVITFLHEAYSLFHILGNILKYHTRIVPAFVRKVKCAEGGIWKAHFLQGIKQLFTFTWRRISV